MCTHGIRMGAYAYARPPASCVALGRASFTPPRCACTCTGARPPLPIPRAAAACAQVRVTVFSKMLLKVPFFRDLKLATREALGAILDIEYFRARQVLVGMHAPTALTPSLLYHHMTVPSLYHHCAPSLYHHCAITACHHRTITVPPSAIWVLCGFYQPISLSPVPPISPSLAHLSPTPVMHAWQSIFAEGDSADKLYIVVEGKVGIFKRKVNEEEESPRDGRGQEHAHADGRPPADDAGGEARARRRGSMGGDQPEGRARARTVEEELICTYSTLSKRPTFGELALWSSKPRAAAARTLEPTKVLFVRSADFATFLSIVPEFADMFACYASAFDVINKLRADQARAANAHTEVHTLPVPYPYLTCLCAMITCPHWPCCP